MNPVHAKKIFLAALCASTVLSGEVFAADRVKTANGTLEGTTDQSSGVRMFKGVPFAAPPVGELRWKEPQPVKNWKGNRAATQFGPRCMQRALFGDMGFRSNGMSEDCLYLNIWTPAKSGNEKLPVLVYFFGGGFQAGDGSEPRYDGESMARKGIVALTVNYRLGLFGFLAHPELTKESSHQASGNYALLDQSAALRWVQQNIAAFGGDPKRVTIAGESAGSMAVSAQMASPLSRDLIAGAIGESGSMMGLNPLMPLSQAEQDGVKFAQGVGASSLAALRAMPAADLLEATAKPGTPRFATIVDGYFFPKSPDVIFAAGEQAHVPLLVGWNSEESNARSVLGRDPATPENLSKAIAKLYSGHAEEAQKAYAAHTDEEALQVATELASDRFIAYSTWKWFSLQNKTGGKPVYRYYYAHPRPAMNASMGNAVAGLAGGVITGREAAANRRPPARGAVHSAEIEYAMGNLATNKVYAWTPDDYSISKTMEEYFANFVKTGNPNGAGLPNWPDSHAGTGVSVMHIDKESQAQPDTHEARYLFLEQVSQKP